MQSHIQRLTVHFFVLVLVRFAPAQDGNERIDLVPEGCRKHAAAEFQIPPIPPELDSLIKDLASPLAQQQKLDAQIIQTQDNSSDGKNTPLLSRHAIDAAHLSCFENNPIPSARECKVCHEDHYREWSVSPHAYAMVSPVFTAMTNHLNQRTNGTMGDFCIRCHTPVGMALNEPINMSAMDRHPTSREGVTCVVCHRINQAWGKGAGRQAIRFGGINEPVVGPVGDNNLRQVLSDPKEYGRLKTDSKDDRRGLDVHKSVVPFFQLTTPSFCGACHDVFSPTGFRLEDAFSEFKASPAARQKQSCHDCHMGKVPGVAAGYDYAPAARIGNVTTPARKRTNHMFVGPDYSIVHPGIFPHNPAAVREEYPGFQEKGEPGFATMREWLQFDHLAGWGTVEFERNRPEDFDDTVPPAWRSSSRRFRARDIINKQLELLEEATKHRHHLLSNGYRLGKIQLDSANSREIRFSVEVSNGTIGHGVPTGFDADRLVFLRVVVTDRNGKVVFVSGDLDPNGDVRDSHSLYVHNGLLPIDRQLFSLQSRFVTRNIRGGEREQVLPVNISADPLPFVRPETRPFTVLGRPIGARKHKQGIEIGGKQTANYRMRTSGCGPYRADVQLIAGMVPVNLVHHITPAGFDYDMSAREVADAVVEGHMTVHHRHAVFRIKE